MEKIGGTKRRKIQGTYLEEEWVALETRLLEQLIRKQFFDIAYKGHAQEIFRTVSFLLLQTLMVLTYTHTIVQ